MRAEAHDGPEAAAAAYEAAAAAAKSAGDTAGEASALLGVARTLAAGGRKEDAAAAYRRLAEMPATPGTDMSIPLLASLRLFEIEGSREAREALISACLEAAFTAPPAQIRYCLERAGALDAGLSSGEAAEALGAFEKDKSLGEAAMYLAAQHPPEGERAGSRLRAVYFGGRRYLAAVFPVTDKSGPATAVTFLEPESVARTIIAPLLEAQSREGSVRFEVVEGRPWGRRPLRASVPGAAGTLESTGSQPGNPEDDEDFLAAARLPGPLEFWYVRARTVGGTVVDLARSKARLLWWAIVLTAVAAIGAIVALLAWARRRSRLATMQTDFVANVTHELKTPLTGIRSLAETLQFGRITSPERAGEFVGAIVRETDRLTRLINNVLDFSRLERGTARLRMERADLGGLVRSTTEAFRATLGDEDGGQIAVDTPEEPAPAIVDADSMSRALTNLLDNAWKYSRSPRAIRVTLRISDGHGVITVSDNGIGIPASQHKKVFHKFYRVDSSLSAETQGAGLGLSLVKAYTEAHGGRIDLQSKPGEGSTFTITVPLAPADE